MTMYWSHYLHIETHEAHSSIVPAYYHVFDFDKLDANTQLAMRMLEVERAYCALDATHISERNIIDLLCGRPSAKLERHHGQLVRRHPDGWDAEGGYRYMRPNEAKRAFDEYRILLCATGNDFCLPFSRPLAMYRATDLWPANLCPPVGVAKPADVQDAWLGLNPWAARTLATLLKANRRDLVPSLWRLFGEVQTIPPNPKDDADCVGTIVGLVSHGMRYPAADGRLTGHPDHPLIDFERTIARIHAHREAKRQAALRQERYKVHAPKVPSLSNSFSTLASSASLNTASGTCDGSPVSILLPPVEPAPARCRRSAWSVETIAMTILTFSAITPFLPRPSSRDRSPRVHFSEPTPPNPPLARPNKLLKALSKHGTRLLV